METVILLANSGENHQGLVSALGLGWSTTGSPTPAAALIVLMKVPWDQTNVRHAFTLRLVDADGRPIELGQDQMGNPAPLVIEGGFEVGRPAGIPAGTPIDNALVINIGPGLPLPPDATYQWRMEIGGEEAAVRSFYVRPSS